MHRFFNRRRKGGFTLIELLVVVLILAILMAVALPLYLSAIADSEKKTCRANMQTIANAVQAARVRTRSATYFAGVVDAAAVAGTLSDLQSVPKCPTAVANTYTVSATPAPYTITCSQGNDHNINTGVTGDVAGFTPGVDNQ